MRAALVPFFALLSILSPDLAEAASPGKRGDSIARATPDSLMRDLSADRPDLTESPYTVDAGHFQLETDVLRYTRDDTSVSRVESWSPLTLNLKAGLDPSTDLQLVFEWGRFERFTDVTTGARASRDGFGDLALRLKRNLFGNDEGRVAAALLPYVSFPTSTQGLGGESITFGLAVPVGVDLGADWSLGVMGQVDRAEDADGSGRHGEWTATATLSHPIAGPLSGFVEFAATFVPAQEGEWIGTADAGVTYSPTRDVQVDAGTYAGVSDAADDQTYFLGLTLRR